MASAASTPRPSSDLSNRERSILTAYSRCRSKVGAHAPLTRAESLTATTTSIASLRKS